VIDHQQGPDVTGSQGNLPEPLKQSGVEEGIGYACVNEGCLESIGRRIVNAGWSEFLVVFFEVTRDQQVKVHGISWISLEGDTSPTKLHPSFIWELKVSSQFHVVVGNNLVQNDICHLPCYLKGFFRVTNGIGSRIL